MFRAEGFGKDFIFYFVHIPSVPMHGTDAAGRFSRWAQSWTIDIHDVIPK